MTNLFVALLEDFIVMTRTQGKFEIVLLCPVNLSSLWNLLPCICHTQAGLGFFEEGGWGGGLCCVFLKSEICAQGVL